MAATHSSNSALVGNQSSQKNPTEQKCEGVLRLFADARATEETLAAQKKLHADQRQRLMEDVEELLRCTSGAERQAVADVIHWADPKLDYFLTRAYRKVTGNQYRPTPKRVTKNCPTCGEVVPEEVRNLRETAAKDADCYWCRERKKHKQREIDRKKMEQQAEVWKENQAEREAEITRLRTMPYQEYLKTEHWQSVRQRSYGIARYRCELCNKRGKLHVHHKTYERRGCEWPHDLIVLCETCHERHHGIVKEGDF